MARLLIGMRLAMLRHESGGWWSKKSWVGLLLAIILPGIAAVAGSGPGQLSSIVAALLLLWTLGMVLVSLQSGVSESDLLPEHFVLLPIPPRKLALGLLAVSIASSGTLILFIASLSLLVIGLRLNIAAALVAVPALVLHLAFVLLFLRVLTSAINLALRTRVGVELVALQYAVLISLSCTGWVLLGVPSASGGLGEWFDELPSWVTMVPQVAPTGWSAVAIGAAAEQRWWLAIGALVALAAMVVLLLAAWSRMLKQRLTTRQSASRSRVWWAGRSLPLSSPLQAATWRELVRWMRDPRSAIEFRVAVLSAIFIVCLPLAIGWNALLPFMGAVLVVMAALTASNSYGLEGTALWLTLMVPGAEQTDVRARQVAFVILFGPLAVLATVAGVFITGMQWTWPWLLAFVPAGLGIAAGVMIMVSIHNLVPVPETARRTGNLMESGGDSTGPAYLTLLLVLLLTLPGLGVTALGVRDSSVAMQAAGVLLGLGIGALTFWWCGRHTISKLQAEGPEILTFLRHPPSAHTAEDEADEEQVPFLKQAAIGLLWTLGMLSIFPQAIVPAVFKLTGQDVTVWFLALYLPDIWQWPAIFGMLAVGGLCLVGAFKLMRQQAPAGAEDGTSVG